MALYVSNFTELYENIGSTLDTIRNLAEEIKDTDDTLAKGYGELIDDDIPLADLQEDLDKVYGRVLKLHMACGTYLQKQLSNN